MRRRLLVVIAALWLAACGPAEPLRIGFIAELTGRSADLGEGGRNAMLLVIAGFPATFIGMFFTGSLLIEVMFSLNGLGLLGYEATVSRDYPVMFGTLYIFTLIGLLLNIISDISYTLVDPRIDFEGR